MVGRTGSIITKRFVRGKLRKSDESLPSSEEQSNVPQLRSSIKQQHHDHQSINSSTSSSATGCNTSTPNNNVVKKTVVFKQDQGTYIRTSGVGTTVVETSTWEFPPKAPTPSISNYTEYDLSLCLNDDNHGFKGLRKQFSGRFKRLITKKPDTVAAIPPELKPQLKTIYVY